MPPHPGRVTEEVLAWSCRAPGAAACSCRARLMARVTAKPNPWRRISGPPPPPPPLPPPHQQQKLRFRFRFLPVPINVDNDAAERGNPSSC